MPKLVKESDVIASAQECAKAKGALLNAQDLAYLILCVQSDVQATGVKILMSCAYNDYIARKDTYLEISDYPRAQILAMQPAEYAKAIYGSYQKYHSIVDSSNYGLEEFTGFAFYRN